VEGGSLVQPQYMYTYIYIERDWTPPSTLVCHFHILNTLINTLPHCSKWVLSSKTHIDTLSRFQRHRIRIPHGGEGFETHLDDCMHLQHSVAITANMRYDEPKTLFLIQIRADIGATVQHLQMRGEILRRPFFL